MTTALPHELVSIVLENLDPKSTSNVSDSVLAILALASSCKTFRQLALAPQVWLPHLDAVWTMGNTEEGKKDPYGTYVRRVKQDKKIHDLVKEIAGATHGRLELYRSMDDIVRESSVEECLDELVWWAEWSPYLDGERGQSASSFLSERLAASTSYQRLLQIKALASWRKAGAMPGLKDGIYDDRHDEFVDCLEEGIMALSAFTADRDLGQHSMYKWGETVQEKLDGVLREEEGKTAPTDDIERLRYAVSLCQKTLEVLRLENVAEDDEPEVYRMQDYLLSDQWFWIVRPEDDQEAIAIDSQVINYIFVFIARRLPPSLRFRCVPQASSASYVRVSLGPGSPTYWYSPSVNGHTQVLLTREQVLGQSDMLPAQLADAPLFGPSFWISDVAASLLAAWSDRLQQQDEQRMVPVAVLCQTLMCTQGLARPDHIALVTNTFDAVSELIPFDHPSVVSILNEAMALAADLPSLESWLNSTFTRDLGRPAAANTVFFTSMRNALREVNTSLARAQELDAAPPPPRRRVGREGPEPKFRVGDAVAKAGPGQACGVITQWIVTDEGTVVYAAEAVFLPESLDSDDEYPVTLAIEITEDEEYRPAAEVLSPEQMAWVLNELPSRVGDNIASYTFTSYTKAGDEVRPQLKTAEGVQFQLSAKARAEFPDDVV